MLDPMVNYLVKEAAKTAASLQTVNWLANAGNPGLVRDEDKPVIAVDRAEALDSVLSDAWLDYRIDIQNELTSSLVTGFHDDAFNKWNDVIEELDTNHLKSSMGRLRQECRALFGLQGDEVATTVEHIVRMACMETAYRRFVQSDHFSRMLRWLSNGRLPCGAIGEFPNTGLLIY